MPFGIGSIAGAALGGLGSLFSGGGQQMDPQTRRIREAIMRQAQGLGNSQQYQDILSGYGGFSPLTQLGIGAMSGDQQAFGQFMNPYMQNVVDQSNNQFDLLGRKAQNLVNDQASQAGAFGGSRAAVASGVAAGQVANQQALANSQLMYGGFNDAMQRAQGAIGLGLQGNQQYLNALGFPASIYQMALGGGVPQQGGAGFGGFLSGALGGGILGGQLDSRGGNPVLNSPTVGDPRVGARPGFGTRPSW